MKFRIRILYVAIMGVLAFGCSRAASAQTNGLRANRAGNAALHAVASPGVSVVGNAGALRRHRCASPGVSASPKVVLTKATTLDARSVTVDYSISLANVTPSLRFDFYRSDQPALDSSSTLIGTQTLSSTSVDSKGAPALNAGAHEVTFIQGTNLPPIPKTAVKPSQQFVVVVANSDNAVTEDPASVNTIYFRKFLIGVVVHGFSSSNSDTMAWTSAMANDLVTYDYFDGAYAFLWLADSTAMAPGKTVVAGQNLYNQLVTAASTIATHSGDVVDIHLIGHSRGTVVISQALTHFVSRTVAPLLGSYIEVTLLDIHPANSAADNLLSYTGALGLIAVSATRSFQDVAADPEITMPANAGIKTIDIWYQQTPASAFPSSSSERTLNLWGQSMASNHITNSTGITVNWQSLTSVNPPQTGTVGHGEIHDIYRIFVVDKGFVH